VSAHRPALDALGLPETAARALAAYLDLLAAWSRAANLTAAGTPDQRVRVLVAPVLPAAGLPDPGALLDVGSGNGSPGLVLAALRADLRPTLLEPRRKRWAFLREAARVLGRPELEVLRLRHDQYRGRPARNLTLRALRLPLRGLRPLIEPGGLLLVWGEPPDPEPGFLAQPDPAPGLHLLRCAT
jgi:16S rRNA (guanine527-N7)-methyltransferase